MIKKALRIVGYATGIAMFSLGATVGAGVLVGLFFFIVLWILRFTLGLPLPPSLL